MEITTNNSHAEQPAIMAQATMKQQMSDILVSVSWGQIARTYFGKSASWLYHKMDGRDGNGKPTAFNAEEAAQLKDALCDLSDRIRRCADSIEIQAGT